MAQVVNIYPDVGPTLSVFFESDADAQMFFKELLSPTGEREVFRKMSVAVRGGIGDITVLDLSNCKSCQVGWAKSGPA